MIPRFLALLTVLLVLPSCQDKPAPRKKPPAVDASGRPKRAAIRTFIKTPPAPVPPNTSDRATILVRIHCQRCHKLPDPGALTQKLWVNKVLPEMGAYLGMHNLIPQYKAFIEKGTTPEEAALYKARNLHPAQPLMSQQDWDLIVTWFLQRSPEALPASNNKPQPPLPAGKFAVSFIGPPNPTPQTTLVHIDPVRQRFLTSDALDESLSIHDSAGKLLATKPQQGAFIAAHQATASPLQQFVSIGVFTPNDILAGAHWTMPAGDSLEGLVKSALPLLKRPVSAVWHDLDHDGRDEIVIAEYGNKTGQLSLFHQDAAGAWQRKGLNQVSGNITVRVADMNHDGWEDLVVLRAQESEDVLIYYNTGELEFLESHVLKSPPYWGSNALELADLDADGHLDLILANGDNADLTNVLKNYHGVRIYRNDGKGGFTLRQTFPLHGAYAVRSLDYDLDGDLDLVTLSTFPDFRREQVSVYLLEQIAPLTFQPYAITESKRSRWMVMDVGDLDGDGDPDIVVGPMVPGPTHIPEDLFERAKALPNPFLLLRNLAVP